MNQLTQIEAAHRLTLELLGAAVVSPELEETLELACLLAFNALKTTQELLSAPSRRVDSKTSPKLTKRGKKK